MCWRARGRRSAWGVVVVGVNVLKYACIYVFAARNATKVAILFTCVYTLLTCVYTHNQAKIAANPFAFLDEEASEEEEELEQEETKPKTPEKRKKKKGKGGAGGGEGGQSLEDQRRRGGQPVEEVAGDEKMRRESNVSEKSSSSNSDDEASPDMIGMFVYACVYTYIYVSIYYICISDIRMHLRAGWFVCVFMCDLIYMYAGTHYIFLIYVCICTLVDVTNDLQPERKDARMCDRLA